MLGGARTLVLALYKANALLLRLLGRHKVCKTDLESLVGFLTRISHCFYGGRCFTRRLLSKVTRLRKDRHLHRLSADDKADMAWWLDALSSNWDGSVAIFNKDVSHADVDLASDAAGCGWGWWRASPGSADFGVGWFPQAIIDLDMANRRLAYASTRGSVSANICQKELYGAYRALIDNDLYRDCTVPIFVDNEAVRCWLATGTAKPTYRLASASRHGRSMSRSSAAAVTKHLKNLHKFTMCILRRT